MCGLLVVLMYLLGALSLESITVAVMLYVCDLI